MSQSYASNNIHYDLPPLMNDGRNFASWQPEAVLNDQIKKAEGIQSNWDYRRFLQNNAVNIMKFNYLDSANSSGNNPTPSSNNPSSNNSPFIFRSTHDQSKPTYGYNNSDLKKTYLTREQLNARMISPSVPTNY